MPRKLPYIPSRNLLATAVLGSLLAHFLMFSQATHLWSLPGDDETPSPIEVRLLSPPAPKPEPVPPSVVTKKVIVPLPAPPLLVPPPPPPPLPEIKGPPSLAPQNPAPSLVVEPAHLVPSPAPSPAQVEPAVESAEHTSAAAPPRRVRNLPGQLRLVYDVLTGEDGFNLGQAVYTWHSDGLTYALESTAEAKGVVSLFMSGNIVQNSRGRIGPNGLEPELFFMEKGGKRKDSARFDWSQRQLILPAGSVPLPAGAQDSLSFPFHWAHTVSGEHARWTIPVTNGRKLKEYEVDVVGHESLKIGQRQLETLHVQATHAVDGTLDAWLAPTRHWLPVRIRSMDQKGKMLVLTLHPE